MARTGRFGRLPRRAPNLTGEIVAMAEAFERQREQNLLAAWNSGGTFEGKKATDGMVLSFWKKRMKEVSKDDPLHEYYKNLHTQYTFSIAESKMTLAYAQKKIGEAGVAAFYRRWAQKVPRRSEIYRELMRNAARFANAASSGSRGSGSSNKAAIYARKDKALYDRYEKAGEFLENQLTAWLRSARYLTGAPGEVGQPGDRGETLDDLAVDLSINPEAGDTGQVYENDAEAMLLLMEAADQDPEWSAHINSTLKRLDPTYSGKVDFNQRTYIKYQRSRMQGLTKRIKLAKRYGVSETDIARLRAKKHQIKRQVVQTRLLDETLDYAESRQDFDAVFNDPESSFGDMVVAHGEYVDDVGRIRNDVRDTKGDQLVGMRAALEGELAMLTGRDLLAEGRTVGESGGMISGDALTASEETIEFSEASANFLALVEAVESGEYGIIETQEGQGNVFGPRNWAVVDNNDPGASLGQGYAPLPSKMAPYKKTSFGEPTTAKEKFKGFGKKEVTQGGGFTYTEYVRTVPVNTRMVQTNAAGEMSLDRRTNATPGGFVPPTTDETLGEVAVDSQGNVVGYKVYTRDGHEWFGPDENPFNMEIAVGGDFQINDDGTYTLIIDPTADAAAPGPTITEGANIGQREYYDPRQAVRGERVKGWIMESNGTAVVSEGSATSMPTLALARMATEPNYRKSVLDTMSNEEITNTFTQDPDFRIADPATQQQMLTDLDNTLNVMRTATSQDNLEQTLTLQRTGDPSANNWQQASEASKSALTPERTLPDGPEIEPGEFGADSWEDLLNEKGAIGITGERGHSERQMMALGAGAIEFDEDGNLVRTEKTMVPEEMEDLDVTQSDAYTSMIDSAKAKVLDTASTAEDPGPSPSPRIKPPTVETPQGQDIGPTPGPSPSPQPSPRIKPDRPEKDEPDKTPKPTPYKVDPNVSTKQDIKNRPPGTEGSPYLGPPTPENTKPPTFDITKPWYG